MSKARILLFLGIWIAVLSYLGFPHSWKNILFVLSGLALIWFSYEFHREAKLRENKDKKFENFSENKRFVKIEVQEELEEMPEEIPEETLRNSKPRI